MTDVLLVVITVVFFAVAVLLVRACDAIIGPDEDDLDEPDDALAPDGDADQAPELTGVAS